MPIHAMNYLGKIVLCILLIAVFLKVSSDDYEIEVQENDHWCQMIDDGLWFSGQDEYTRRCTDE